MKKTKFMSVLVAVLFIFSIINPSFAVVENFSNGKADMGITKDVENNNIEITSSKVTFNNAKVKNIWRLEDNGTPIYYATVSYGSKESNVEISKNLYNYIASGKVSQENISFSVNEAEPKYVNNTYIIQGIKPKVINGIIEGNNIIVYNPDTDKLESKSIKGLSSEQSKSALSYVKKALKENNIVATVVKGLASLIKTKINDNTIGKVQVKGNQLVVINKNGKVMENLKINVEGLSGAQKKNLANKYTSKLNNKNKIVKNKEIKGEINKLKKEVKSEIKSNTCSKVQVKGNNLVVKNKNGKVMKNPKVNVKGLSKKQKETLAKKYTNKLKNKNIVSDNKKIKNEINKLKKEVKKLKPNKNKTNNSNLEFSGSGSGGYKDFGFDTGDSNAGASSAGSADGGYGDFGFK